jgi:hypothetical protein
LIVIRNESIDGISFTIESEEKMVLTLIIIGLVFFVGIYWVVLSFGKGNDRADRDMRIICNEEFSNSDIVGQNQTKLSTENKNSDLPSKLQPSSRLLGRSSFAEP